MQQHAKRDSWAAAQPRRDCTQNTENTRAQARYPYFPDKIRDEHFNDIQRISRKTAVLLQQLCSIAKVFGRKNTSAYQNLTFRQARDVFALYPTVLYQP
jgi:hypothetical protein